MKYAIPILTVAAIGLVFPGTTFATATAEQPKDEVERQSVAIKELQARDDDSALVTELGKAEAWLQRARPMVEDRRSREEFRRNMDRVGAMVALVDALLDEAEVDAKAEAAQSAARTVEEKLAKVMASADALEAKKAELEEQVAS